MQQQHASVSPILICKSEKLDTICTCPRCKQDFMLGLGVVIRTHYFKNNVEHYGWLAFHDLQCATLWLPAINTLPA